MVLHAAYKIARGDDFRTEVRGQALRLQRLTASSTRIRFTERWLQHRPRPLATDAARALARFAVAPTSPPDASPRTRSADTDPGTTRTAPAPAHLSLASRACAGFVLQRLTRSIGASSPAPSQRSGRCCSTVYS